MQQVVITIKNPEGYEWRHLKAVDQAAAFMRDAVLVMKPGEQLSYRVATEADNEVTAEGRWITT